MNNNQNFALTALALLSLSGVSTQAAERTSQAPDVVTIEARALSPSQLAAVRGISRNVLAAKKSGSDDGADAAQLVSLRASLDQLIAVDLDPKNRAPITVQGQESGEQGRTREKVANLREVARSNAVAMASQLRRRGELNAANLRSQPEQNTRSAGMPIGEQRVRLFERWAQKLDAALANDGASRAAELHALREQLRPTRGGLSKVPVTHGTPTLQAMPAGFVPPRYNAAAEE
jgi:hypothetical protein